MDFSQFDFPRTIWGVRPRWEIVAKVTAFIPVIIVGFVGNGLVIYLVTTNRILRTPINIYILNLTVAETIGLAIMPIVCMCRDFYQNYVLGRFICKTEGFIRVTLLLVSVFTLSVISYDRLKAILFPFWPRHGIRTTKIVIAVIWLVSVAVASPLISWRFYMERQWRNFYEMYCSEQVQYTRTYWLVLLVLLFWLPLTIISVSYSCILGKIGRLIPAGTSQVAQRKRKLAKMSFVMILNFLLWWTPFAAVIIIRNENLISPTGHAIPNWLNTLWFVSQYIMCLQMALNPIVYALMYDNFQKVIKARFPRLFRPKPPPPPPPLYTLAKNRTSSSTTPSTAGTMAGTPFNHLRF